MIVRQLSSFCNAFSLMSPSRFFHSPPCAEHVTIGLVDKQQVDILRLQLAQALVDALGSPHLKHHSHSSRLTRNTP